MSCKRGDATKALVELKLYREARDREARALKFWRWPDRVIDAGVAAKLRRWSTWRDSLPGDAPKAALFDRIMRGLMSAGVLSW